MEEQVLELALEHQELSGEGTQLLDRAFMSYEGANKQERVETGRKNREHWQCM